MNYSIKKLIDDFFSRLGQDELLKLENVLPSTAFNYVFFKYKEIYGDYPTGDLYRILEDKFVRKSEIAA